MESSKSIRQNMLMNMALTVSNLLFPLITYSYVARILLSQGTGRVAFVQSVLTYFSYLASLGIGGYATRECARVRHDRYQLSVVAGEIWKIQRIATAVLDGSHHITSVNFAFIHLPAGIDVRHQHHVGMGKAGYLA